MYAEVFASRIKKARAETGFTQREVAKKQESRYQQ